MRRALLLILVACGDPTVDPEAEVSIEQGAYGLTISGCDTSGCEDEPYDAARVYATPPAGGAAIPTTSDEAGFFELALPAGTYQLCVHSCTTITIGNGERVRRDFISGPGGGIWCDDTGCRPGG